MLKGFTRAHLSCGCALTFRDGTDEASPVTVILEVKAPGCTNPRHVSGLALYDYREALRPSTRFGMIEEEEFEEEG
jgi:hypothetical protein